MEEKANGRKSDRRVQRTKKHLTESLILLMKEKDIKDISVKELAELADINRGTFYLHYRDVYDMLEQLEEELFLHFNQIFDEELDDTAVLNPREGLTKIFTFLYDNRGIVQALIGPHGDLTFITRTGTLIRERMYRTWEAHFGKPEYFDFYFSFFSSGCIGLLRAWKQSGWQLSPEELAGLADLLICHSPLENGESLSEILPH